MTQSQTKITIQNRIGIHHQQENNDSAPQSPKTPKTPKTPFAPQPQVEDMQQALADPWKLGSVSGFFGAVWVPAMAAYKKLVALVVILGLVVLASYGVERALKLTPPVKQEEWMAPSHMFQAVANLENWLGSSSDG